MVIDGKVIAEKIYEGLRALPAPSQKLIAVLVGGTPDSVSFVSQKEKTAQALRVRFQRVDLKQDIHEEELLSVLQSFSNDNDVGGIILQLPLPEHINIIKALSALDCRKDIDVLNVSKQCLKLMSPTAGALQQVLKELQFDLSGKNVALIGQGKLVGQPIAAFLRGKVGQLHLYDKEHFKSEVLLGADLVITGVGMPGLIRPEMLKTDAVVIDFGYTYMHGVPQGDFAPPDEPSDIGYTPTPGGTGPIVVAQLFVNFYAIVK